DCSPLLRSARGPDLLPPTTRDGGGHVPTLRVQGDILMNGLPSIVLIAVAVLALAPAVAAQIAVSANDNKVVLDNGVVKVVPNAPPDTVAIIDLRTSPPKVIAEVQAPVSVVGPPL